MKLNLNNVYSLEESALKYLRAKKKALDYISIKTGKIYRDHQLEKMIIVLSGKPYNYV